MIILPAIDIKDGACVRLYRGDFATAHQVAENPLETARQFESAGARWIHMVDLDGAKTGIVKNANVFLQIAKETGLKVELGGGIRTLDTVASYLEGGISRVILGSAAIKDPALVREAVRAYGDRIVVGIDAKDGKAAAEGWLDDSDFDYLILARRMEELGVRTLIFTDIARDGMQEGLNLEQLEALSGAVSCEIIASGGVRGLSDIRDCARLGLAGVICGKALYSGALSLREAIETAGEQTC